MHVNLPTLALYGPLSAPNNPGRSLTASDGPTHNERSLAGPSDSVEPMSGSALPAAGVDWLEGVELLAPPEGSLCRRGIEMFQREAARPEAIRKGRLRLVEILERDEKSRKELALSLALSLEAWRDYRARRDRTRDLVYRNKAIMKYYSDKVRAVGRRNRKRLRRDKRHLETLERQMAVAAKHGDDENRAKARENLKKALKADVKLEDIPGTFVSARNCSWNLLVRRVEMILAAHSLGSREDGVLKLEICKGDGYSVVRRKIIEGLRNQIGEEGGEIEILQMWHGGYYLNLADLGGRRDFHGVSGDPVLFRYKVKDVGTAAPADTMRIYVETMILETVTLSVRPSDTVNDVRFNLRKNEGISGVDQRLSFAGEQLVGSRTLSSYSVRADSTLGLFLSTVKRVVVNTPWSKGIHLEVRSSDTVRDVKRKIKGSDATPPGKKHLFFAGRQLEDTRTLSHCRVQLFLAGGKLEDGRTLGSQGIEDQSTLLLLESDPKKMQVFVTNPKDKPLVLDVQPSDTIHSLKAKIHDSKGFPPIEQKLYSGNRYLAYGAGTLQSHNIGNGALLRLSVSGILVKTSSGDNLILHPEPSDTLYDVKKLILDRTGAPPDQQVLYQQRPNLSDFHTLSDYNIGDGSILTLGSKSGCSKKRPNFANEADSGCIMKTRVSKDGPKYREVQPGMCLEGKCTNSRCPAFGEMGVLSNDSRNEGFQDYDLARAATRPCSQCRDDVRPTTCAFNNCMWRYEGQKAGEGHTVVGPWTEVGDAYHRFEEHEGVQWKRLLFQARKAQPVLWKAKRARGPVAIDHTYKNCTLCETEVGYGEGELLKCGHWFHGKCIKGWGSGSAIVCPICRKKSRSKEGGF